MLGFVRSPGLPPWPGEIRSEKGSRLNVSLFGTSRIALIQRQEWIPYTKEQHEEVDTQRNKRRWGALKAGLKELSDALNGEKPTITVDNKKKSGHKKTSLRKQQIENDRKFDSIMRKMSTRQWRCNRCDFSTGYKYRAKTHSVLCSSMFRVRKKRARKFTCSSCPELITFPSKKLLRCHTMKEHPQVFLCVNHPSPVTFTSRKHLKRHLTEKHSAPGMGPKIFSCPDCPLTSKRKENINRHIRRKHPVRQAALKMIEEVIFKAVTKVEEQKLNSEKLVECIMDEVLTNTLERSKNVQNSSIKSNVSLKISPPIVGSELSEYEIEREKNVRELEEKFKEIFAEEYERRKIVAEENEKKRILRASLKQASKMRLDEEKPKRKSPRLCNTSFESTENPLLDDNQVIETAKNTEEDAEILTRPTIGGSGDFKVDQLAVENSSNKEEIRLNIEETRKVRENIEKPMNHESIEEPMDEVLAVNIENSLDFELELNDLGSNKENVAPMKNTVNKKLKCEKHNKCTFRARDNYALRNHYRAKHEKVESSCSKSYCNLVFDTLFEKELHVKTCIITCQVCGKSFNRGDKWESHKRFESTRMRRLSL